MHDLPVRLAKLRHITSSVHDADAAQAFLEDAFGAVAVRGSAPQDILDQAGKVRHVALSDVRLQFIEPRVGTALAAAHERVGPGIVSLAYGVADLHRAETALAARGIGMAPPTSVDDGGRSVPTRRVLTAADLGFDLELIQEGGEYAGNAAARLPAAAGCLSPLFQVELAVDDVRAPLDYLRTVFGAPQAEIEFAAFLGSLGVLEVLHADLGGVLLQYCRPLTARGSWAELVKRQGRAVHNLTFLVDDMDNTVAALRRNGVSDLLAFNLDFGKLVGPQNVPAGLKPQRMVDLRALLGFHLELSEVFAANIDDYVLNPVLPWAAARTRSDRARMSAPTLVDETACASLPLVPPDQS